MTELTRRDSRLYVVALLAVIYTATWRVVVASAPAPVPAPAPAAPPAPAASPTSLEHTSTAVRMQPRTELRRQAVRRARTRSS